MIKAGRIAFAAKTRDRDRAVLDLVGPRDRGAGTTGPGVQTVQHPRRVQVGQPLEKPGGGWSRAEDLTGLPCYTGRGRRDPDGRCAVGFSAAERKVRTPTDGRLANGEARRRDGKCHREETADGRATCTGKGERVE